MSNAENVKRRGGGSLSPPAHTHAQIPPGVLEGTPGFRFLRFEDSQRNASPRESTSTSAPIRLRRTLLCFKTVARRRGNPSASVGFAV